jgi:hypothetical protein
VQACRARVSQESLKGISIYALGKKAGDQHREDWIAGPNQIARERPNSREKRPKEKQKSFKG